MKCVRPSPDGTWPHSIGKNFTGLLFFLGAIILEINNAGAVAATANPNISKMGLKLPATSPTNLASNPTNYIKRYVP